MKKRILSLALSLTVALSLSTTSTFAEKNSSSTDDQTYEYHYETSLKNLDVQLYGNDELKVSDKKGKKKSFITSNSNETHNLSDSSNDLNNLQKALKNKKFKKDFIEMFKSNKAPIAIGVTEAEVLITLDENGNEVSSRLMTNKEVKEENENGGIATASATNGQTQTRDGLSLYTSVVDKGSGKYWVQSNGYWNSGEHSTGNEAIAVTWESAFGANNDSASTISYKYGSDSYTSSASLQDFEAYKGVAWSFKEGDPIWGDYYYLLYGAYAGISVTRTSGSASRHYFTSEYVHTYSTTSFTASIETDATKLTSATLTLTPTPTSWKLVSYIQGDF